MAFSVEQFKQNLTYGGARNSLFQVEFITAPSGVADGAFNKAPFLVRAAQIPAATITPIDVQYFGRAIRYAGNRTFADWTVTVLNDEDFQVRDGLEAWSSAINSLAGNRRSDTLGNGTEVYKTDAVVTQFSKEGDRLRSYKFFGLFPIEVSAIDLAWDADTVQEFTTTFTYDYWTVDSVGGQASGSTLVVGQLGQNENII